MRDMLILGSIVLVGLLSVVFYSGKAECQSFGCFDNLCFSSANCSGDCVCLKYGISPSGKCVNISHE